MNNCNEFVGKLRAAIELRIWCDNYKVVYIGYFRIWKNLKGILIIILLRKLKVIYCLLFFLLVIKFSRQFYQALFL